MFKKCKYCGSAFKGTGYFCSDMCEIKNHASEVMTYKKDTITTETKKEFDRVEEGLSEASILTDKIVENKENSIQVRADLKISKVKIDKFKSNQVI